MSNWTDILPALLQLFSTIAPDEQLASQTPFFAEWKEGQRGAISDVHRFSVFLKVTSMVGLGGDETRYEYVDPGEVNDAVQLDDDSGSVETDNDSGAVVTSPNPFAGQLRATIVGQRKFTLSVEVLFIEHTDAMWAFAVTERIRTRIWRQTSLDLLDSVNVAIIDVRAANKFKPAVKDRGRVVSAASFDVIFGACISDPDPTPMGWIERIGLTSHISDVDGVELPIPPNYVNKIIPPVPDAVQQNFVSDAVQFDPASGAVQSGEA